MLQVWLVILLVVYLRKYYATILNMNGEIGKKVRTFRPNFSVTLLPITLGVMVLTALYRNGLLTKAVIAG